MAKPILLIRAEFGYLTNNQLDGLKSVCEIETGGEYHLLLMIDTRFSGITFEVHGNSASIPSKVTIDPSNIDIKLL